MQSQSSSKGLFILKNKTSFSAKLQDMPNTTISLASEYLIKAMWTIYSCRQFGNHFAKLNIYIIPDGPSGGHLNPPFTPSFLSI